MRNRRLHTAKISLLKYRYSKEKKVSGKVRTRMIRSQASKTYCVIHHIIRFISMKNISLIMYKKLGIQNESAFIDWF